MSDLDALLRVEPYETECIERDATKGIAPKGSSMTRAEWDRRYLLERLAEIRDSVHRLAAPTPPDALREAAQALVTATVILNRWDEAHGYAVNSERDALAGDANAAWDALRAALEADR